MNEQIPMPTLTFTEGDTAVIYAHNELNESTSLHWHGLFLPNKEDGVPNLTQMPIEPPLGKRLRGSFMVNTDKEYMIGSRYIFTKNISLAAHYDSDMGFGAGLTLIY